MRLTEEQYADLMRKRQVERVTASRQSWNDHFAKVMRTEDGMAPKRQKYGNRKVTDSTGAVHDSGKEYRHWCELQLREIAGEIRNLRRHVPLACVVNGIHICDYEADAMYDEGAATILVDAKSPQTRKLPAYRLKLKLVQALHKLQIREV